jgi:hypothetical protein
MSMEHPHLPGTCAEQETKLWQLLPSLQVDPFLSVRNSRQLASPGLHSKMFGVEVKRFSHSPEF